MTYSNDTYGGGSLGSLTNETEDGFIPSFGNGATYRVIRDSTTVEDAVFDVDPVVDTANPFGDFAVVKMDDSEGMRFLEYARGTRVDVQVGPDTNGPFITRFTGYVVERRETEQDGADVLEVEAYSF